LSATPLATFHHHSAGVTRDTRDNLSSYSYTAFEDSRTCEASLEKSKVALPWYTANLDPCETQNLGFELLEIWWILQVPSPRRTSYPQVEVMSRKGLISLWNEPSSRVRNSGKTSVPSKFAFTGCTTVVQKHWTYVNIKVIQSSEFFLNLVVCTTIGLILWLMDPWISMKLRSPVHPVIYPFCPSALKVKNSWSCQYVSVAHSNSSQLRQLRPLGQFPTWCPFGCISPHSPWDDTFSTGCHHYAEPKLVLDGISIKWRTGILDLWGIPKTRLGLGPFRIHAINHQLPGRLGRGNHHGTPENRTTINCIYAISGWIITPRVELVRWVVQHV
jgi:hypothetical protein